MNKTVYPVICRQTELPFYLTEAAIYEPVSVQEKETPAGRHTFVFTESGSGKLFIGETGYALKKGCIAYLAPGTRYGYEAADKKVTAGRFVFGGENAEALMKGLGFDGSAVKTEAFLGDCTHIFAGMFTAAEEPVRGGERSSLLIYEFLLAARRIFAGNGKEGVLYGNAAEEALRYMDENYTSEISLEMLADLTGVTLQHFCRVFRERVGMRPMEYLARKRIAEAKKLLDCTDMRIQEIGQAVGIADRNYFGITFKKYEGITPTEYRRNVTGQQTDTQQTTRRR